MDLHIHAHTSRQGGDHGQGKRDFKSFSSWSLWGQVSGLCRALARGRRKVGGC